MKLLIASIVLGMAVTAAPAGTTAADASHAAPVQMADAGDDLEAADPAADADNAGQEKPDSADTSVETADVGQAEQEEPADTDPQTASPDDTCETEILPDTGSEASDTEEGSSNTEAPAEELVSNPEAADGAEEDNAALNALTDADSSGLTEAEILTDGAAEALMGAETEGVTDEVLNGWTEIDQKKYYYENGVAVTGFSNIDGAVYHFEEDGSLTVGAAEIDGSSYYFGNDGKMKTGFVNIDQSQYYFDSEGRMTTGWQKINGFRYNMGEDGVIRTGWQTIDGDNYFFYTVTDKAKKQYKGTAVKGFFNWKKGQYYFDACNIMTLGWQKINGFRYNMGTDGKIKTGWQTIDGKTYYFYPVTVNARGHYKGTAAVGHTMIGDKLYYFQNDGVKSNKMPSMTLTAIDYKNIDYYGDATLLYSGGKYLLIDTGSKDTGPKYVINYLKKKGVHKLDIYISHYHDDHMANVDNILKDSYFTVGTIYMPDHSYMENQPGTYFDKYNNIYKEFIKTANKKGVKKVYLRQGSTFTIGDCTAKVLYMEGKARLEKEKLKGNAEQIEKANQKYLNNRSLVTMFTCGEIRYLNCGDLEYEVEKKILDQKIDVKADIFKLSHHAADTGNSGPFQNAVNARYAYHTNPDSKKELGKYVDWADESVRKAMSKSNLYASMFNGNITFTVNKGQITVNPEKNYKTVTVKGVNMISGAVKDFSLKIAKGASYVRTNLSLPVAYKL